MPLEEILLIKARLGKLLLGFNLWSFWKQKIEAGWAILIYTEGHQGSIGDKMRAVGRETLREAGDLIYISGKIFKNFYYSKIIDFLKKYVYVCLLVCMCAMCVQGPPEVKRGHQLILAIEPLSPALSSYLREAVSHCVV